ncbi:putative Transposase-associated domain-containing protein [Helianthus annuus]|nr:putative Transposase-associated domain-containing protein [Helianthus annuus]
MDTSWMSLPRATTTEYENGLDKFLDFIFSTEGKNGQISCPCIDCSNQIWVDREEARTHLQCVGFIKGYRIPPFISESCETPMLDAEDDMQGLVHDAFNGFGENIHENEIGTQNESQSMPNTNAKKFYKALEDAKKELYPGCKLFHSKCIGKCNDEGFSMMLDTLREAFPYASIPKSLYDLRKIIRELGLSYDKIDACPNDCMLYWKENSKKTECDICHTSRYKANEIDPDDELTIPDTDKKIKKIGAKVLRHFPLIPRLQRLFMSSKTAASMR